MSYLKLATIFLNEHNNPLLSNEGSELNTVRKVVQSFRVKERSKAIMEFQLHVIPP